uniref:Methyltransferase domain-containing protein n=1 Tax=Panagrolaimus davidi TaxID=227884 RepID=A0A914Q6B0_9BILA
MESLLKEIAFHSALSLSLSFGYELGLFDALSAVGSQENPASPKQVADKSGMDVEVVKVWLMGMHSGKIIKANEAGNGYWIEKENLKALSSNEPAIGLILTRVIPHIAPHYKQALETAKSKKSECQKDQHKDHDGDHEHGKKTEHGHLWQEHAQHQHSHKHGHGHEHGDQDHHSHHSDNFPMMELMTKAMYKNHIIPDYLPLTGMQDKLEKGGLEVLDVGCGVGIHICEIAQHFPKCNFTGIDIGVKGIERAKEIAKKKNLKNVKFEVISGEEMPEEWTNKFDWVMSWNSIHDHQNPQVAIKEINRVLNNPDILLQR